MISEEKISEENITKEQVTTLFEEEMAEAFKQFMAAHFSLDQDDEPATK